MTTTGVRCVMTISNMPKLSLSAVSWDSRAVSQWNSPTLGKGLVKFGWMRPGAGQYMVVS